ncbi:MAG: response regulator transcription factor [Verrucomicrobia bacterium]|nr:response regulator transcription factor [Verrucomicrobiota bacterium]
MHSSITISVVEDNRDLREGLRVLIDGSPGFRCLNVHRDAETALTLLPTERPNVVLMDIRLPGLDGIECTARLKPLLPDTQIAMLTVVEDTERIFQALRAGATGYLIKSLPAAELLEVVAEVHRGGSPMSSTIARKVVQYFHRLRPSSRPDSTLSDREKEILTCLTQGQRDREIAQVLSISLSTVRTHIRKIYEKLQVHSRTAAVVKYLQCR